MRYLALLTPASGRTMEDFGPYLVPEKRVVWAAYKTGKLREFYLQPDPPVVTLVYEAPDLAAVDHELDQLPMVQAGLLDRRVVQLGPWLPLEVVFDRDLMTDAHAGHPAAPIAL